jgi:hypothetical protein
MLLFCHAAVFRFRRHFSSRCHFHFLHSTPRRLDFTPLRHASIFHFRWRHGKRETPHVQPTEARLPRVPPGDFAARAAMRVDFHAPSDAARRCASSAQQQEARSCRFIVVFRFLSFRYFAIHFAMPAPLRRY